ncbi:MAG: methylenetetrahydrofolate reductase [Nocardioides sp.]|uniref:methylenetetrahydrofolate reductase n=1 Tax=Nocardioides sp. TaxID=35761 RepID=UPI0039E26528
MVTAPRRAAPDVAGLLRDFSLEMTGKDVTALSQARASIPPGTRVNVTYLAHEDLGTRVKAARAAADLGLVPVPHVSARRLGSPAQLEEFLEALQADGNSEHVFVVGGDPRHPEGPYPDALAVIESGLLQRYGVRHVGVAGYPGGHPTITTPALWQALQDKTAVLRDLGLQGSVITQFGFDPEAVAAWVEAARQRGITVPIRVGVPGPAGAKRLLSYATRFGVATSAGIARKYGLSLTNLMGSTGPDRFIASLAERLEPKRHGEVKLHFYTFGGLAATADWIHAFGGGEQMCCQSHRGC